MAHELPEPVTDDQQDHVITVGIPPDDHVDGIRDLAATRRRLATVISVGFCASALLVVIGGMVGRFGPDLVGPVVAAWVTSQSAVAYFYFRREPERKADRD